MSVWQRIASNIPTAGHSTAKGEIWAYPVRFFEESGKAKVEVEYRFKIVHQYSMSVFSSVEATYDGTLSSRERLEYSASSAGATPLICPVRKIYDLGSNGSFVKIISARVNFIGWADPETTSDKFDFSTGSAYLSVSVGSCGTLTASVKSPVGISTVDLTIALSSNPSNFYSVRVKNSAGQILKDNLKPVSSGSAVQVTGLPSFTSQSLTIEAVDRGNAQVRAVTVSFKTDANKPTITGLVVSNTKYNSATVTLQGLVCEAGVSRVEYAIVGQAPINAGTAGSYTFSLTGGKQYRAVATVYDTLGNFVKTPEAIINTPMPAVPAKPVFTVLETKTNSIKINVTNVSAESGVKTVTVKYGSAAYITNAGGEINLLSLSEYTKYNITVEVTDNYGQTSVSLSQEVRTLSSPPTITSFTSGTVTANSIDVNVTATRTNAAIQKYNFYLDGSLSGSVTTGNQSASFSFTNLSENTSYSLAVEVVNEANVASAKRTLTVKTLEDKWLYLSVNGGAFIKCNAYLITTTGTTKIVKSKRHIIK